MKQYLACGKIINTHGVRGDVKIDPWTDEPEVYQELETVYALSVPKGQEERAEDEKIRVSRGLKVVKASMFKGFVLCHFEGVEDFDAANKLKNYTLYVNRDDIPREEGTVFVADLLGLPLIDADNGTRYGKIKDVINRGAGDIYDVDVGKKDTVYFPAVKAFIDRIALGEAVYIRPPKGLFDEDYVLDGPEGEGHDEV